jgi:hypothetical protein
MTRSIFDPDGGETEQSGSTFLGPHADNISHMPPDVTDGEAAADDAAADADTNAVEDLSARADELPATPNTDSAEVARRLAQMTSDAPGASEPQDEMPPPAGA